MTDEALVEVMARALDPNAFEMAEWPGQPASYWCGQQQIAKNKAQRVLTALRAAGYEIRPTPGPESGWWPAPWEATEAMIDAAAAAEPPAKAGADTTTVDWVKAEYGAHRDAHLAEQPGY